MPEPFESSWHRIDRAADHRVAAAQVWNEWMEREPYRFLLDEHGEGKFAIRIVQDEPAPPEMAIYLGEWLYNLRCALDYAVYDTAVCVSGKNPPPGHGQLQMPVYFTETHYREQEYRLKSLAPFHRTELIESMQPYRHPDPDTSALGWLHRLARNDRHRTLHVMGAYAAELRPRIGVPEGCNVTLDFGKRVVIDDEAEVARFTITPWQDDWEVDVQPQTGLDPEIADWVGSEFWRAIPYNSRLRMIDVLAVTIVVPLEYDCTGHSRKADILTDDFRAQVDDRREERESTGVWI